MTKSHNAAQINSEITKTELQDSQDRANLLYGMFGKNHLKAETYTFQWMDKLCEAYQGGYWYIYTLSNGAFYMAPTNDDSFTVYCFGYGQEVELSADAAGLVACLFAVNQLANETRQDQIIDLYHKIREYALNHTEAAGILLAID